MKKHKRMETLAGKVVLAWMVVMAISNIAVGAFGFSLYRGKLLEIKGLDAQNVATAMAIRIDGDKFSEILQAREKNDYWYEVKEYADHIAVVFDTAYIYILDASYDDSVTYFAEGAPGEAAFDFLDTEIIEGIYDDMMFETIRTGKTTSCEPYDSGDYGEMVSGFAAITNSAGKVVGVVGVDFFFTDVNSQLRDFLMSMALIVVGFLIGCYFLMSYLGTKLAGAPLGRLDDAARQLVVGDMDINLNIKSTTEIGRLAQSFELMVSEIRGQVEVLESLAQGDLTSDINVHGEKDTMGIAIRHILSNLNNMFSEINQTAASVSQGARHLADNAQSLAVGANEQSAAVENLNAAIGDMSRMAKENLEISIKTNNLTSSIKDDAQTGTEHMTRMTAAVKEIADASVAINKVIKVIDDIAFQTNILALNAAVEAARAGAHGKGFAVVAEEVRNLAAKSAEAAKDTERLISDSMEKAQFGATIADETAVSLARIIGGVNECATMFGSIAGSLEKQIQVMDTINHGIEQVSRVVERNSQSAEESAQASSEMSAQSDILAQLVSNFKLRPQNSLPGAARALPKPQGEKGLNKY